MNNLQLHKIFHQLPFGSNLTHQNSTLVRGKVGCIVGQAALLGGQLGGSVLLVDMDGATDKIWMTLGFGLQGIIIGFLGFSGPYTFKLSYVIVYNLS